MAQTYYTRPYSIRVFFVVELTLLMVSLTLYLQLGSHPAPCVFLAAFLGIAFVGIIFDPDTAYNTSTLLDDGRVGPVKKPLVGLKSHETKVGITGGYEVRVDGWRYEEALIRI